MVVVGGKEIVASGKYAFLVDRERMLRELAGLSLERKGGDVEAARRFTQAQYRNIYGAFARCNFENVDPLPPSPELRRLVQANVIRWAKSKHSRPAA